MDQCTATNNVFYKKQALMECPTAETMMDGLRNRVLHQTTEIMGCLESITNTDNAVGKVKECIENT